MVGMIDQLLDLSRFRIGGGISLSPAPSDLRALTDQVLGEFEDVRPRFLVEVVGDTAGTWDADRLLQVVSNLVGNAVQHSPPDSPIRISIQGRREDTVVFQIQNLGKAIPEELRGVLFEPFRGSGGSGRKQQRLGLGLYITRQIVLAHGGVLSFESSQESGTCFTASIPRHALVGESKPVVPGPTKDREAGARAHAEKTVLIVEDDQASRLALRDLLGDLGYQVRVASKPSEALKLVDGHDGPVHVLLTDVRLPEMGGEELASRLRDSQPDLEVFFMSGLSEPPAGACSAFFQKPIDIDALAEALKRVVA